MATGIKIYNNSGTVQIDESYRNLCFKQKLPYFVGHNFGIAYVDVIVAGSRVLMCMESANYSPFLFNTTFDGTFWTYRWGFQYLGGGFPTSDTVYAWIFDYITTPPAGTVGLKVYDGAGDMVFHSDSKPLKIVSVQTHPSGYIGTSGRKYLPLVMLNSYYTVTVFPNTFGYTYGLRSSGAIITPDSLVVGPSTPTSPTDGLFAAVDVTYF